MIELLSKNYADYVSRGLKRCELLNTEIDNDICCFNISAFDLDSIVRKNEVLIIQSESIMEHLSTYMSNFISVLLVNKDGYVLSEKKCNGIKSKSSSNINIPVGGRFSEKFNGNTSISTSIIENKPICLLGKEHYCKSYYDYATLSAPIYDNGEIIGVLAVIGLKENVNTHTLGMIASCAEAISIGVVAENSKKEILLKTKSERAIAESITDGVLIVDKDGFVNYLNQVGADILCVDREKSLDKHITEVVDFNPVVLNVLKTGKCYIDKEFILTNKAGNKLHFVKTATPIKDEAGNIVSVVDTFRKIKRVHKMVNEMTGAYANYKFDDIVGSSSKLLECVHTAKAAAKSLSNILITGESGTGKELIVHSIHNYSDRKDQPFVSINCGAIPRELLESELFGYEPGSFTGASNKGRIGKFELADGGTIFLDEIGEMPLDMQVKLLRVLQDRKITRIGGNNVFDLDVRIVAATNKNLVDLCKKDLFREDLYYRINVMHVNLPPLRERKTDIPELIHHFLNKLSYQLNKDIKDISPNAMEKIMSYDWPGNIRELENIIERAVNICNGQVITEGDILIENINSITKKIKVYDEDNINEVEIVPLEVLERRAIEGALKKSNGNISLTANLLKVTRNTIYNKMKKYNLEV
ncbi:sigma 54-interacting transcriptional regulator [Sedimentibacter sp. MB31-C6]|uniref:sigma 54-interacting transcriptional regulator n=1 Tax=Sedimentibacter sp. MB31-C6 TaxID=3109366 RepID=UPI002DDD080D|nr:sigma 54-interacting transcriptional regulator [Sedimentibacter sp. MB36-C1]WSI03505.1 sigma 54-interacting transcriptional regulator [Sedimentibacter sp. MB36-C1]